MMKRFYRKAEPAPRPQDIDDLIYGQENPGPSQR